MNHYRVITDLRGIHRLQARRSFLFWLWNTIATGSHRSDLQSLCNSMEADLRLTAR